MTVHIWVGHFESEDRCQAYFAECWDPEDEDRVRTPLSEFARDQGERWYDHDVFEYSHDPAARWVADLARRHSYANQYAHDADARAVARGVAGINTFVFIGASEIDCPRDVAGIGFTLHYLGSVTCRT